MENVLYYGDNLDILRRYLKDESVDLIHLNPPVKSNQSYNALFKEQDGTRVAGVLIPMEDCTKPTQTEAAGRYYESPMWNREYPKIQLLTVAGLLAGKQIDMPPVRQVGATYQSRITNGRGWECIL